MSHLHNLLRDARHTKQGGIGRPGWRGNGNINNDTVYFNNNGIVNQTIAIQDELVTQPPVANYNGSGILISQPVVDDTPYRVKGMFLGWDCYAYLFIGYGPSSPVGQGDQATKCTYIPLAASGQQGSGAAAVQAAEVDEVIIIPGLSEGDPDYQKPIAIGFMMQANGTPVGGYHLSVQNMAKTAPQFAASMS